MSNAIKYDTINALLQQGEFVYKKTDSDKLFYPNLISYAERWKHAVPLLWDQEKRKQFPNAKGTHFQEYQFNEFGYRGKNFKETPADILASGCSQTWGSGVPNGYLWPEILEKNINLNVDNIGFPGKSTAAIVQNIFSYFREIGHPKYVFIYLPDLFRFMLPVSPGFLHTNSVDHISDHEKITSKDMDMISDTNLNYSIETFERPKYMTSPYYMEEIITPEITIWQALNYLQMLEEYCKIANINLKYGSWDNRTNFVLNKIKTDKFYLNFIDTENEKWIKFKKDVGWFYSKDGVSPEECHSNLIDNKNKAFWNVANDCYQINGGHMGVHQHIHIAEIFEREVLSVTNNTTTS